MKTYRIFSALLVVLCIVLLAGCNQSESNLPTVPDETDTTNPKPTESSPSATPFNITETATANPDIDLAYIQVSTGKSGDSTDLVYKGVAVMLSCFDSNNKAVSINNMNAALDIGLYDNDGNLVNQVQYDLILNYLPAGQMDNVLWIDLYDFMPVYGSVTGAYPYRKFEGNVKLVLSLPDHNPVEAVSPVKLYLNGVQQVSQKEYSDYEIVNGAPPPNPTDSGLAPVGILLPENESVVSTLPTFIWDAVPAATSYNFQIALDPDFRNIVDNKTGLPNIYSLTNPLDSGQTYYWRWQATTEYSSWSWVAATFTTR